MATLIGGYISLEKLEEIVKVTKSKNEKGFKFTASISEQPNQYGQNVSLFAEQSKEDRDAKKPKYYFGNGKVFWTDGVVKLGTSETTAPTATANTANDESDLPF